MSVVNILPGNLYIVKSIYSLQKPHFLPVKTNSNKFFVHNERSSKYQNQDSTLGISLIPARLSLQC